jgi:hypothetical protein
MVAEVNRGASSGLRLQVIVRLLLSSLVLEHRSHPFDSAQGRSPQSPRRMGHSQVMLARKIRLSRQFASMR